MLGLKASPRTVTFTIDRHQVSLDKPIKMLGLHPVRVLGGEPLQQDVRDAATAREHDTGRLHARLLFQRQFRNPSAIELVFHQVVGLCVVPSPENYDSIIFDASLTLKDGVFRWTDGEDQGTWIAARCCARRRPARAARTG